MKKFLALVLALVMTMSLVTISAGAKDFNDNADISYDEAVAVMSDLKSVDGDTAGNFNPTNGLTRGAAAKIICNLILGPTTAAALNADTDPYVDVDKDSVFAGYIAYCAKEGIVSGYADGTFKPAAPLTGYAFLKMLLGALGYDAAVEGYTGANWSINVAKQAIGIGLNADLLAPVNDSDMVTREVAMLYAFNTLKATMVDYDTTITIGDVTVAGSNEYYVANNAKNETIADDNKMQFAEKYFSKLTTKDAVDAFERPATTWVNGKETIGTFVNYATMVEEYTTGVAGNELANVIGKTALKDYDFYAYVDGAAWGSLVPGVTSIPQEITKNNKTDVSYTGNGVLTQVFVDNDKEEVIITMINTFLAQATMDYNAKKDSVTFDVFGLRSENGVVSGEDFDVADVAKDDFVLVTYSFAEDAIQTIEAVEIIADTEIEKFSKDSSLTIDGENIDYSAMIAYDTEVLDDYTGINGNKNLKDTTYNVYLDKYGYVIGVDIVSTPDDYLFVTGYDTARSNLANKNWDVNVIFMDGTSAVVKVKNGQAALVDAYGVNDAGESLAPAAKTVNAWYKFTKNSSDVYTLTLVEDATICNQTTVKVSQSVDTDAKEIDAKHISLKGNEEIVYGNAASIYLLADLDKVDGTNVIVGADEVVTGVKNAAFTVGGQAQNLDGVYPLYKNTGYVIAAVVVGESATVASDYAYFLNTGVDSEAYNKTTGMYTWTRTAIIAGEEVVLKEVNDTGVSYLEGDPTDAEQDWGYVWVEVKYDANGNVKKIVETDYENSMADAVAELKDAELVLLDSYDDPEIDTPDNLKQHTLKGNTMYDMTDGEKGILVAEDVKVVLYQQVKNDWVTDCSEGVEVLEAILNDLNEEVDEYTLYYYYVVAVIEDGIITSVIVLDYGRNGDYDGPEAGDGSAIAAITVEIGLTEVTYEIAEGAEVDATDLADAIEAAMNKAGYSKVVVDLAEELVTAEKDGQSVILPIEEAVAETPVEPETPAEGV